MKKLLILAFLFLSACAPDSKNNDGNAHPEPAVVVSAEVQERADVLSRWYEQSMQKLALVEWYVPGDEMAPMVEGFVFGSNLPPEFLEHLEIVPAMVEALLKIQDHSPRSREMLNLARKSLKD